VKYKIQELGLFQPLTFAILWKWTREEMVDHHLWSQRRFICDTF